MAAGHIVVADNGSDPRRRGEVQEAFPLVRWNQLDNPGYGAAVNRALDLLDPELDHLLVLTHEVVLARGCIEGLVARLRADPLVGMVGPLLWWGEGVDAGHVWSTGGRLRGLRKWPVHWTEVWPQARVCSWLDGAAVAMRRRDLEAVGGYDESYFLYLEDVDLALRLHDQLGLHAVCDPVLWAAQTPGGHMGTYLAVRNVLWLFKRNGLHLARALFVLESVIRLAVGPVARPRKGVSRARQRARGLVHGMRPGPRELAGVSRPAPGERCPPATGVAGDDHS